MHHDTHYKILCPITENNFGPLNFDYNIKMPYVYISVNGFTEQLQGQPWPTG